MKLNKMHSDVRLNQSSLYLNSTTTSQTFFNHFTFDDLLYNYTFRPVMIVSAWILVMTVVLGNMIVVTAIWREKQLHSATNFLVASLAVADLLVGLIVMPFSIVSEIITDEWYFGSTWCDLWHSFDVLGSTASISNLVAISYDRYLAITDPFNYPAKMTYKRITCIIILLWTLAASISFPAIVWWRLTTPKELIGIESKCIFTSDQTYVFISSIVSFYAPLIVMLFAYYKIYIEATRQTKFLRMGSKTVFLDNEKKNSQSYFHTKLLCCFKRKKQSKKTNDSQSIDVMALDKKRPQLVLRAHRGGGGGSMIQSSSSLRANEINRKSATIDGSLVKPPASLIPLMVTNSDTSNDSHNLRWPITSRQNSDENKAHDSSNNKLAHTSNSLAIAGECYSSKKSLSFYKKKRLSWRKNSKAETYRTRSLSERARSGKNNENYPLKIMIDGNCVKSLNKFSPEDVLREQKGNQKQKIKSNEFPSLDLVDSSSTHTRDEEPSLTAIGDKMTRTSIVKAASFTKSDQSGSQNLVTSNLLVQSKQKSGGRKLLKLAKERKAAKTLGIVVGVFVVCWLPFFVVNITRGFCSTPIYKQEIVMLIVTWLGWSNSAINPFIYACWSRDFRRAFRKVIKSWWTFASKPISNMFSSSKSTSWNHVEESS